MNLRSLRWLLLIIAGGLVGYVLVQRRRQLASVLPQPLVEQAERIVIPWSALERTGAEAGAEAQAATAEPATETEESEEGDSDDSQRRKVSRRHRISYQGKQYGPLPEALVGQYVEVETRDDQLYVLHNGTPVASFKLQS